MHKLLTKFQTDGVRMSGGPEHVENSEAVYLNIKKNRNWGAWLA